MLNENNLAIPLALPIHAVSGKSFALQPRRLVTCEVRFSSDLCYWIIDRRDMNIFVYSDKASELPLLFINKLLEVWDEYVCVPNELLSQREFIFRLQLLHNFDEVTVAL